MGEVSTSPEVSNRVIEDLSAMEVDPEKGERLYKAAVVLSNSGAVYRMLSKILSSGKLDLVHYGCDLDEEGNPTSKWRIRKILEQNLERFDKEIETIKKSVEDDGEQVAETWLHDLTTISDVPAQSSSLSTWSKEIAGKVKNSS